MNNEFKKKLKSFKWRYIEHIDGNVYQVFNAKEFNNPKITRITDDSISFWHDDCCDHTMRISLEDILIF